MDKQELNYFRIHNFFKNLVFVDTLALFFFKFAAPAPLPVLAVALGPLACHIRSSRPKNSLLTLQLKFPQIKITSKNM